MPETAKIRAYQSGMLPFEVDVYLDTYDGPGWVKRVLRGRSGWLRVSRATMSTPISDWTTTLAVAITDDGVCLGPFVSSAILDMRSADPRETQEEPDDDLDGAMEMLMWDFLGSCDLRHLRMLSDAEDEIAARVAHEQARGERVLADADAHIATMRRQRRDLQSAPERRAQLADTIAFFEDKQSAAAAWLVRRVASMREERVQLEADVFEALENHGEVEELYTARWVARHSFDRTSSGSAMGFSSPKRYGAPVVGASAQHESGVPDRSRSSVVGVGSLSFSFGELRTRPPTPPTNGGSVTMPPQSSQGTHPPEAEQAARPSVEPAGTPAKKTKKSSTHSAEERRIALNALRLRTAAQHASAKRREAERRREREVDQVIDQFPTIELLETRLERVPSTGSDNRRLARLIRLAIRRLTDASGAERELTLADEEEGTT